MIRVTGIEEKDRILSPYWYQWRAIKSQCGSIDSEKYMDLIDTWLDNILKAIEDYDRKTCNNKSLS